MPTTIKATQRNIEFINNYKKDKQCQYCKYNKYPQILQFHHLRDKRKEIYKLKSHGYSIQTINKEINKCILLCPNCHAIIHLKQNNLPIKTQTTL
jgi:hypothetical protein